MQSMSTNISQNESISRRFWIVSPSGPFAMLFNSCGTISMRKFCLYDPDLAKFSSFHHGPCLSDHWITAIAVHGCTKDVFLFSQPHQFKCMVCVCRNRFFQNNVNPRFNKCFCYFVVRTVGSHYSNDLNLVFTRRFCVLHLKIVSIRSVWIQAQ